MTRRTRNLFLSALGVIALVIVILFFFRGCPTDPPERPNTDLSITKRHWRTGTGQAGDAVRSGDSLVYQIDYANNGNQAVSGIVVIETVPEGATFDLQKSDATWFCDSVTAGSTCTLSLDTLDAGSTGSADFAVVVDASLPDNLREICNIALISDDGSGEADPNPGNNRAQACTPIATDSDDPDPKPDPDDPDPDDPDPDDPDPDDPDPDDPDPDDPQVPELSGIFCELCKDALERGQVLDAYVKDYRRQCDRCPDLIDPELKGYTLIVSSRPGRDEAEEDVRRLRARLNDNTLPISVLVGKVENSLRYRVALGQTATLQEAIALRDSLSEVLPDDTWIFKIR